MKPKEWFSLDIATENEFIQISKNEEEELNELYELYTEMKEMLDIYFKFRVEFLEAEFE
tara:strand:+ start:61768 stop:61944 length:177 start_codon:yes stop_codon:yes gene_type:complete